MEDGRAGVIGAAIRRVAGGVEVLVASLVSAADHGRSVRARGGAEQRARRQWWLGGKGRPTFSGGLAGTARGGRQHRDRDRSYQKLHASRPRESRPPRVARSRPRARVCARPTHCLPPSARLLRATGAGRGVRSDGVHTTQTSRLHRGSHVASWLSVEATPRLTPTETSSEPRPCSEPVLAVRAQGQTTSTSTARPLGSTR